MILNIITILEEVKKNTLAVKEGEINLSYEIEMIRI